MRIRNENGVYLLEVESCPPTMSGSRKTVTVAATGSRTVMDAAGDEYTVSVTVSRPVSAFDKATLLGAEKRRAEKDAKQKRK